MEVHLHSFHCARGDQSFDGGLFLVPHSFLFGVMLTPLSCEEVSEPSQSLSFSLDFSLVLAKLPQSDDVRHDTRVTDCLDRPCYRPVHLEALPEKIDVVAFCSGGDLGVWSGV